MTPTIRPNILLFLTDDHAPWALGCYGNTEVETPVLDALAAEGTRFDCAFTPSPVCSPARACLMTGRAPSQVGIHDWIDEALPDFAGADWLGDVPTLAQILAAAGYRCGLSGKWHLGQSHTVPPGYQWCFGIPNGQGHHTGRNPYHRDGVLEYRVGNKTEIITDEAIGFLKSTRPGEPFFLQVGYVATHSPWDDQDAQLAARYSEVDVSDAASEPHPWSLNEGLPNLHYDHTDVVRRRSHYYAAITDMDRHVGRILATLDDQGQLDDTIVVYTSDHGLALGQRGIWGKGNGTRPLNMYETSIRVPLIWHHRSVRHAGIERCVDHYDTFRTLLEIAGVELSEGEAYPGSSYAGLLRHTDAPWDDAVVGEYGDLRMVRTPDYKLVRRYPAGPHELFDLVADPTELTNLAGRAELSAVEQQLDALLEAFYAQFETPQSSGLKVQVLRQHNLAEAWRDGLRELRQGSPTSSNSALKQTRSMHPFH